MLAQRHLSTITHVYSSNILTSLPTCTFSVLDILVVSMSQHRKHFVLQSTRGREIVTSAHSRSIRIERISYIGPSKYTVLYVPEEISCYFCEPHIPYRVKMEGNIME